MKRVCAALLAFAAAAAMPAGALEPGRVELLCHRTANKDVPENTLESLDQAALLGCDVVEVDVRKTLDGKIVLNHDGLLERLTDGVGDAEKSYYDDLRLRDVGGWMGDEFTGMRIALFADALRLARERNIRLDLDIKTKGIGADILRQLEREGMLERVQFGGEWDDVKRLYPDANAGYPTVWVQPGVTAEQVKAYHRDGKAVMATFSANGHEMDLAGMKAAVAAGVDGINVDYPRLGADAVGRPVERTLKELALKASAGESSARADAILKLSRYRGFPLQDEFAHWLSDADDNVSRAAAVALVTARPQTPMAVFVEALHSIHADARANSAWALGQLGAPAGMLLPLLKDTDPGVLQEALLSLSRAAGDVSAEALVPLLSHPDSRVRGATALALARHQPDVALQKLPAQLRVEMTISAKARDDFNRRGKPQLTPAEFETIVGYYRCEMKFVEAIAMLKGPGATQALEEQAFRPGKDFSQNNALVAGFQLWERIGTNAQAAIEELGSSDPDVADRAEWMLVEGGPGVLPEVRKALGSENAAIRDRAIHVVAWQGDTESITILQAMQKAETTDAALAAWALEKIESLHPQM